MAEKTQAGDLQHTVIFAERIDVNPDAPEDFGNVVSTWVDGPQVSAQFIHLRGGETVMAGRLSGKHAQVIRVRSSPDTQAVTTDWRVRDARTGAIFNIRDVTATDDRGWLDFLCESGVA